MVRLFTRGAPREIRSNEQRAHHVLLCFRILAPARHLQLHTWRPNLVAQWLSYSPVAISHGWRVRVAHLGALLHCALVACATNRSCSPVTSLQGHMSLVSSWCTGLWRRYRELRLIWHSSSSSSEGGIRRRVRQASRAVAGRRRLRLRGCFYEINEKLEFSLHCVQIKATHVKMQCGCSPHSLSF